MSTKGLCFCCTHQATWNGKVPGFNKSKERFDQLGNYTHCRDDFWLSGEGTTLFSNGSGSNTHGVVGMNASD